MDRLGLMATLQKKIDADQAAADAIVNAPSFPPSATLSDRITAITIRLHSLLPPSDAALTDIERVVKSTYDQIDARIVYESSKAQLKHQKTGARTADSAQIDSQIQELEAQLAKSNQSRDTLRERLYTIYLLKKMKFVNGETMSTQPNARASVDAVFDHLVESHDAAASSSSSSAATPNSTPSIDFINFTQRLAPLLWYHIERALAMDSSDTFIAINLVPSLLIYPLMGQLRTIGQEARGILIQLWKEQSTRNAITWKEEHMNALLSAAGYIGAFDLIPSLIKSHSPLAAVPSSLHDQLFSISLWTPSRNRVIDGSTILSLFDHGLSPSVISSRYISLHDLEIGEIRNQLSVSSDPTCAGATFYMYKGKQDKLTAFAFRTPIQAAKEEVKKAMSANAHTSAPVMATTLPTSSPSSSSSSTRPAPSRASPQPVVVDVFCQQLLSHWSTYVQRMHVILLEVDPSTLIPPLVAIIRDYVDPDNNPAAVLSPSLLPTATATRPLNPHAKSWTPKNRF